MKKMLNESISAILFLILNFINIWLALASKLNQSIITIVFFLYGIIFLITKFNEDKVKPIYYFNRSIEGVLIIATPFSFFSFTITYILEGFTELALLRAQFCVIYTFLILIVFFFSIDNLLGPIFLYSMGFELPSMIIDHLLPFSGEQPLILVPELILLAIFSLFGYYSQVSLITGAIKGKDYLGDGADKYRQFAKFLIVFRLVIGILILVFRIEIYKWIIAAAMS